MKDTITKVAIQDAKLVKILSERAIIYKEIMGLNKKIEETDKERKKLAYKMDALKEKTKLIVDRLGLESKLQEFEVISKIYLDEDGQAYYEITDQIEAYKEAIRDDRKKKAEAK